MPIVIDDAFRAVGRCRIGDSRNVTRVERDHEANADQGRESPCCVAHVAPDANGCVEGLFNRYDAGEQMRSWSYESRQ